MTGWTVIVPVKGGARAKSRLPDTVRGAPRAALAIAFGADTLASVVAAPGVDRVLVVPGVSDLGPEHLGRSASEVQVIRQPAGTGLNRAVAHAAALVTGPVAVVLGDLPSLRPEDLGEVLEEAALHSRGVVGDAEGEGSTVLTASVGRLPASFGPSSLKRHLRAGCADLDASIRVRADVDTEADVERALTLGVGPHTAAALGVMSAVSSV
ncbi:2-phospho-L-lactate guanylyltransferase [Demequina mangrovi]|uniref:2-phospho-L-lactate guanylyltransferase n=1 Tax=Demequina mangrovi TaxID=1043493 RepID=A0A1H6W559_9MICO|nr:2-phospho-L-lactate guanylyltransferase [Demequina mangrovi]SEJ12098.1 2-phospho-L-lactate guanylyltransferase [Demequina mangrovi]